MEKIYLERNIPKTDITQRQTVTVVRKLEERKLVTEVKFKCQNYYSFHFFVLEQTHCKVLSLKKKKKGKERKEKYRSLIILYVLILVLKI